MIYLTAWFFAALAGVLLTRTFRPLLLEHLRYFYLLPPALLAGILPLWLDTYRPDLIWTTDRRLLLILQILAYGSCLLFALLNLIRQLLPPGRAGKRPASQARPQRAEPKPRSGQFRLSQSALVRRLKSVSWLTVGGLLLALAGLSGQLAVLLTNHGYMPLTADYLNSLSDPVVIEGIRNNALRLYRLINDQTRLAWLGQVIPLPFKPLPGPSVTRYTSLGEVLAALSVFMVTLSSFIIRR